MGDFLGNDLKNVSYIFEAQRSAYKFRPPPIPTLISAHDHVPHGQMRHFKEMPAETCQPSAIKLNDAARGRLHH